VGATGATFTPDAANAPFNSPGTFYIIRKAILSSGNNVSPNPYIATNESNAATVTVNPLPTASISGNATYCKGDNTTTTLNINVTGTPPWSGTLTDGTSFSGSANPISVSVNPVISTLYYISSLTDANCSGETFDGDAAISIIEEPNYTKSNDTTICINDTATLKINTGERALLFNGTDGNIVIPNSNEINTYQNSNHILMNRTVALWFKTDDITTRQVIYEEGGGINGFSIFIENGYINVHGWEDQNSWGQVRTSVNTDTWYYIAFVFNSNSPDNEYFKGYLNGVYFGGSSASAAANGLNAHSGDIRIGNSDSILFPDNHIHNNNYFSGYVDEFKLWNRSLSANELLLEKNNVNDGTNSGDTLVVYYNYNNDSGTTITDETGGNDGTATNSVTHEKETPFTPTILWSPGNMTDFTVDVSPVATTNYIFTLTEPTNNCQTSGTITVTVNNPTTPSLSSNNPVCRGNDAIFTISGDLGDVVTYNGDVTGNATIGTGGTVNVVVSAITSNTTLNLTNINNGSCDLPLNNISETVTVNNPPAITTHPSTSVDTLVVNDQATPLSITATGDGLTYQWYSNTTASNSGGTAISGATSSSYTPSTATTGTLYYYCVVTGTCSPPAVSNVSGGITVQDYCAAGAISQSGYISRAEINNDIDNSTGTSSGGYSDYTSLSTELTPGETDVPVTLTIGGNWNAGTISTWIDWNRDGDFNDTDEKVFCQALSSGAISYTFNVPATAALGITRMRIRLDFSGTACSSSSCGNTTYGEVEDYGITVSSTCIVPDIPTVTASASPICEGNDVTLTMTGDMNSATHWGVYTGSCGGTLIGTTTTATYTVSNVAATTTYYVRGIGGCITTGSCGDVTVTVNPLPTATLSGDATICEGESTNLSVALTGTQPWSITYTDGTTPVTINNITTSPRTISVSPTTTTTYSLTAVSDVNCTGTSYTGSATITVNPTSVGGTATAANSTICNGSNTTITLSGYTGTIQWQQSANGTSGWTNVTGGSGGTTDNYTTANLTTTTYYRAEVTSGTCSAAYSNTVTIDIYSTTITSGTVGGAPVVEECDGGNPGQFSVGAPSGGDGNYIYQWEESVDCSGTWIDATAQDGNTTSLSFDPPVLTDTICYRLEITDGCGSVGYSTTKTYNVVPDPVSQDIDETPADGSTICIGNNVSATFSGGSGGTGTVTDVYEYSTDGASNWSSYTSGNNITATAGMVGTDMIQIRTRRTATGSGCNYGTWNYVKWTVAADNTIVLSSSAGTDDQSVCLNTTITDITYATTGATGATFSGLPSGVTGNWAADVVTISGSPSAFGTFNYTVTLTGGCGTVTANGTITVEDNEDPTITCPATVEVTPDQGLCTASGIGLGSPTTSDNCHVASVTNNASEPYSMGNTIVTWTVTDDAGNSATCDQTVTVQPAAIIDIRVEDLGNSCQSGETGSTTTITWDITLVQGSNSWTYDYTINDGTTDVQTGTNVNASGNIQISYDMNNTTAVNKTYTITLTNVKDNCGVAETNTGNNSDVATMYGVPPTSDITTN
jgi:hypothetical protein